QILTSGTGDADLVAVLVDAVADPGRRAVGVHDHHVGDVDRGLLGHDAAGLRPTLGGPDAGVLLDPVDALDEDPVELRVGRDDLPLGALVLARDDADRVALFALHGYKASGASEMIFMKRLSRSSRPTGPKMRVPRGSPPSLMITAAFSSKRMYEPS